MIRRIGLAMAGATLLALAGCDESAVRDFAPKAERKLPPKLTRAMQDKGMTAASPVMFRIFKEEATFEVWKQKNNGRYELLTSYDICKMSGELGPKFREGDRQAPEGFYPIRPALMNPKSSYYLSFDTGYPNSFDRAHGRTGSNLMVHGACSSSGCYSMTDDQVAEIYAFARDAFRGGQKEIQLQAYPFRMSAQNLARYHNDPNFGFWSNLKEGYDHFELTKTPPKVDVCEKRYVFNRIAPEGTAFKASEACPDAVQSDRLAVAYAAREASEKAAFNAALTKGTLPPPKPSIAGHKEAALVSAWSKARASGQKVSASPPSFEKAGGEQAAVSLASVERSVPARAPVPAGKPTAAEPAAASETAAPEAVEPKRKRWWNPFGG